MSKNIKPSDTPLTIEVENDILHIRIGVDCIKFCLEEFSNNIWPGDEVKLKVTDAVGFAKDVATELSHEQEDGTTPVHLLFDEAVKSAVENGSAFVEEPKTDKE